MPKRPPTPARGPSPSDQLAELIRTSGMTPADLAAAASVASSVLSRFLRGERSLNLATVDRLAAALGGLRIATTARRGGRGSMGGRGDT